MHIEMVVVVQMFIYRYTAKMHLSMMVAVTRDKRRKLTISLITITFTLKPWIFLYSLVIKFVVYETSVKAFVCITRNLAKK